ncbi:hypothetical protein [Hyphobacterium sp.]
MAEIIRFLVSHGWMIILLILIGGAGGQRVLRCGPRETDSRNP